MKKNVIMVLALLTNFALPYNESSAQVQTTGAGGLGIGNTGMSGIPGNGAISGTPGTTPTFIALTARGGIKLPEFANVQGSPYLHPDFQPAFVRLKSGFSANTLVKFNLFGNEIIFLQNNNELALDSVDYVSYEAPNKDGKMGLIRLKSGFPAIGKLTQSTIYQLLDSGVNLQLMKHTSQHIDEVKPLGMAPYKEFITKEEYYIHITGEGIKKIKADKRSVQEALPQYARQIEELVKQKKLNLKKETDLVILVAALNNLKAF